MPGRPGHRGRVDVADHRRVSGWSIHAGSEDADIVEILVDGVTQGTAVATRYRQDLRAAGLGEGRHGFDFWFRAPVGIGDAVIVEVRSLTSGELLTPGPRRIGPVRSRFDRVLITPFSELLDSPRGLSDHRGGPHWPDFQQQTLARHCRGGRPVDASPHDVDTQTRRMDESVAWGGPIVAHFGHQIAEFSMRLLPTVTKHGHVSIAFAVHPRTGISTLDRVPSFVTHTWDWFGISRDQVRLVTEPAIVRELVVEPQAEQLWGVGPCEEHLAHLDALTEQRLGPRTSIPAVYVSRAGQRARFAAEVYVERVFEACGVTVVRPETLPLEAQLRTYASAERLMFASGSAVHATQLLGRSLGDVHVLARVPGQHLAEPHIGPRARSLCYLDACAGVVHGFPPARPPLTLDPTKALQKARERGIVVLDPERFVEHLTAVIPGLASRFDVKAFELARDHDVMHWLSADLNPRWAAPEWVVASLQDAGLGHLIPQANQLLGQRALA